MSVQRRSVLVGRSSDRRLGSTVPLMMGKLAHVGLIEAVQLIAACGKPGILRVREGEFVGRAYVRDGRIVHALVEGCPELGSRDAALTMLRRQQGVFAFWGCTVDLDATLDTPLTHLCMQACAPAMQ